jgi:hypothetical protein
MATKNDPALFMQRYLFAIALAVAIPPHAEIVGTSARPLIGCLPASLAHIESPFKIRFQCSGIPFHEVAVFEIVLNRRQSAFPSKRLHGFGISYHAIISRTSDPSSVTREV